MLGTFFLCFNLGILVPVIFVIYNRQTCDPPRPKNKTKKQPD